MTGDPVPRAGFAVDTFNVVYSLDFSSTDPDSVLQPRNVDWTYIARRRMQTHQCYHRPRVVWLDLEINGAAPTEFPVIFGRRLGRSQLVSFSLLSLGTVLSYCCFHLCRRGEHRRIMARKTKAGSSQEPTYALDFRFHLDQLRAAEGLAEATSWLFRRIGGETSRLLTELKRLSTSPSTLALLLACKLSLTEHRYHHLTC